MDIAMQGQGYHHPWSLKKKKNNSFALIALKMIAIHLKLISNQMSPNKYQMNYWKWPHENEL